jgi:hypothetical protein
MCNVVVYQNKLHLLFVRNTPHKYVVNCHVVLLISLSIMEGMGGLKFSWSSEAFYKFQNPDYKVTY